MQYKTGQRIENIDPDRSPGRNKGQYGTITDVDGEDVYVDYDNGTSGHSDNPSRYYKVINKNVMGSISKFVRNLTLSKGEKLMRKHGLKNDCGEYSETAKEIVLNKLCADNEAELISMAEQYEADLKAEKE